MKFRGTSLYTASMRLAVMAAAALCVAAGSAASASAGTLATAPMYANPGDSLFCVAANTGTKPLTDVTVAIMENGTAVNSSDCPDLAGGAWCGTSIAGNGYAYCVITVKGSKAVVRGELELDLATGNGDPAVQVTAY